MSDKNEQMNFIIIISDTLRRDFLSCYNKGTPDKIIGKRVDTRYIQQFAEKSLVFDNCYSASFPTVPHRRDVFTGAYTATYKPWAPLTQYEPVLQDWLCQRGYTSMMISDEAHILENGFNFQRGFSGWEWIRGQEGDLWKTTPKKVTWGSDPSRTRNPERQQECHMRLHPQDSAIFRYERNTFPARTGTCVMEWLEDNYDEGPFYLYVDFFDPHEPWDPPQWYIDMYYPDYDGERILYPKYSKVDGYMTEDEVKFSRSAYAGEVTLIDRWVGKIFQKAEDLGLFENTVIFFTTDHGFLIGDHGFIGKSVIHYEGKYRLRYLPLYEEISHIPLIIHHPDVKPGRRKAIVQPPDFFPTIADFEGTRFLAGHGESFKDVVLGKKDEHREFALSFPFLFGAGIPISIVKDGWSAVFFSEPNVMKEEKIDKAVDGYEKVQEPWEDARDMLFNLEEDPGQEKDLAPEKPELMKELRQKMLDYLDELDTDEVWLKKWKKD